ncbi:MAG: M20 family metallopeptidase [Candidatus Bathyarchaeota archaeon]|nr:M20 family metallopeptidase [Candidatus Bathyarchaeota archaeon]
MSLKDTVSESIDKHQDELIEISKKIHSEPELGHQEAKASKLLVKNLKRHGFKVEYGVAGMETAFIARKGGEKGPAIGILAEYDALPGIGHACGHNLISMSAYGAAIGLAKVIEKIEGRIIIYGTPAEEGVVQNAGGKVVMIEKIKEADSALMIHAGNRWGSYSMTNARESFLVEFHGKSSHAGAAPEKAVNALEGVLLTFQGINALRQHLDKDTRIHGIIKHGGDTANTIPDYASAHLYVRAPSMPRLEEIYTKVKNIIKGAELATGARSEITQVANTYANKIPNKTLSDLYRVNMGILGVEWPEEKEPTKSGASTDFGNVSQVMPALSGHVYIGDVVLHSPDGAKGTATQQAHEATLLSAKAIAYVALDLLTEPGLLEKAKQEHKERIERQG